MHSPTENGTLPSQPAQPIAKAEPGNQGFPAGVIAGLPLQKAYRWEQERATDVFLTQPWAGQVRDWTWAQAMDEARRVAAYLRAQDWPAESRIVVLSKNCAWWMMAELAIWMAGHVSVPIYPSLMAHTVRALLEHCEPVACFIGAVEDPMAATEGIPPGVRCISFPTAAESRERSWDSIVETTQPLAESPLRGPNDPATLIYTSGTTGKPKGVMHRFAAFGYFVGAVTRVVGEDPSERMLSYLPLAHIAERALVEATAFHLGLHVYFVESVATFQADLRRARPTILFTVPRLLTKFQQGVLKKMPQKRLDTLLRIPFVRTMVSRKILSQLGLDSVRLAASGGAPLPVATLEWFRRIGLHLIEGYGMTETGITHTPEGGESRPGYVGNSVPGVETRIGENGEVLVRSPMNMTGYFKDEDATRQAFTEDGFFRTGDLGELDSSGWLKIIGRVKEQFKTSKGKYVSPSPIEKLLSTHPDIESCCVMGSGAPQAYAIVLLSPEARSRRDDPGWQRACEQELRALLDQVNAQLEAHEHLQFLVITDEEWTIANGFLTPTMKLRRSVLESYYARYIDEWRAQQVPVVWHSGRPSA